MDKFDQAVKLLDINCVVIIENDLKPANDAELVLSHYIILSKVNKEKLKAFLLKQEKNIFVELLDNFNVDFLKWSSDNKGFESSLKVGKILRLFKKDESNSYEGIIAAANQIIESIKELALYDIFFKFGITQTYGSGTEYDYFIEKILNPDYQTPILLYENVLPTNKEAFKNDLISICGNNFTFFAIIDNKLGEGDNEGLKIASDLIPQITEESKESNNVDITCYSIIFTSTDIEQPDSLDKYDSQLVVKKTEGNKTIDEMYKKLTISSFSRLIEYFKKQNIASIEESTKLIGNDPENLTYFINKANKEGIISYEAIRIWFENAINYHLNNLIKKDYSENIFTSTVGLTKMFDSELLVNEDNLNKTFLDELDKISINEIFDYSVNEKHLPIGPGDIFKRNDEYFVLLGQECDISIREKDHKRTSELAEMVLSEFLTKEKILEQYKKKETDNSKGKRKAKQNAERKIARSEDSILFNHFCNTNNEKGYLKINLKTKALKYIDFRILDLCMFNSNGDCKIEPDKEINKKLVNYFTAGLIEYYDELKEDLKQISNIEIDKINVKQDSACQIFNCCKENGSIDYQFKRVCRINGDFNHFIHHRYWNYRGRIGLNELNLADTNME